MKSIINTIIIGSGPAGISAAIYLKRAGLSVMILEKGTPGGQINETSEITNYPGYSSILGSDLANNMISQLNEYGTIIKYGNVNKIEDLINIKKIYVDSKVYECKNIIIASGRRARHLNLIDEEKYIGHGISFCALCDGNFFKNKNVAVVGGGDASLKETIYLSKICNHITIIHRKEKFRASSYLINKLNECTNIDYKFNYIVDSYLGNDNIDGIIIKNTIDDSKEKLPISGLFIYIGEIPNTEFCRNLNILNKDGYIMVDSNMETSIKNIYAIGDVIEKPLYQVVTATSDGAIAANSIINKEM